MKNLIKLLLLVLSTQMFSQEIGIRLGQFGDNNAAIDGVVNFDDNTRLHGDITFGNGIGANLLYDFTIKPLSAEHPNLQYYLGLGLGTFVGSPFILGVNGEVGIEYLFKNTPITIGLDWRPQLDIITTTKIQPGRFGLNIRYRINEL